MFCFPKPSFMYFSVSETDVSLPGSLTPPVLVGSLVERREGGLSGFSGGANEQSRARTLGDPSLQASLKEGWEP